MSTWRRKAIETFPDLRQEVEDPDTTIYGVFFELLPRVHDAHTRHELAELKRIYGFAEWCFHQDSEDLWNAAAVAFYEHLADEEGTRRQIPHWIKPDDFEALKPLFESRLGPEQFKRLCESYEKRHGTKPS